MAAADRHAGAGRAVASEADAARVPEDLEPMLAPGGRISIGELITEELLLALPIVPLHEPVQAQCAEPPAALTAGSRRARRTSRLRGLPNC